MSGFHYFYSLVDYEGGIAVSTHLGIDGHFYMGPDI